MIKIKAIGQLTDLKLVTQLMIG